MIGTNIAIDFGSSSTELYVQGKGVILDEPTMIAVDVETGMPIAIGNAAYTINGRTDDSIEVISPIVGGIISNYTMAEHILKYYLQKILKNSVIKPNVVISIPSGATGLERRTFLDIVTAAGAGRACLIEESLASAVGIGIKNDSLSGRLLVNMGGGSIDVSVVTMGSIAVAKSLKIGGISIDEAIMRYLKKNRDILIGPQTAERLKICLGSAVPREEELAVIASGKSCLDNMPISFEVTSTEIFDSISEQINMMIQGIKDVLEKTPPELVGDISDNGVTLTGGTSLLWGMDKLVENETGIETKIAEDAMYSTVNGAAAAINDIEYLTNNGYTFQTVREV
jgi:rod shape-determining protein MreB